MITSIPFDWARTLYLYDISSFPRERFSDGEWAMDLMMAGWQARSGMEGINMVWYADGQGITMYGRANTKVLKASRRHGDLEHSCDI